MITVHLPPDLAKEFVAPLTVRMPAENLAILVQSLNGQYPGLATWLLQADGRFREHLGVFVNGRRIKPGEDPLTPLSTSAEVWILRAISGG